MLQARQTADTLAGPEDKGRRVNLLNWDGKGTPSGLFPPKDDGSATPGEQTEGAGGTSGTTGGADLR
jgi:nitrate reductase beta subunit